MFKLWLQQLRLIKYLARYRYLRNQSNIKPKNQDRRNTMRIEITLKDNLGNTQLEVVQPHLKDQSELKIKAYVEDYIYHKNRGEQSLFKQNHQHQAKLYSLDGYKVLELDVKDEDIKNV